MTAGEALWQRLSWAVILLHLAGVLALVCTSAVAVYDEGWYLATVQLLIRDGLGVDFLRALPGPAGPTFTIIYAPVYEAVGLEFPWIRLVSTALVASSAVVLAFTLAGARTSALLPHLNAPAVLIAGAAFSMPLVGVSAGMALTESPGLFVCLFLLLAALSHPGNQPRPRWMIIGGILAGLCLGVAICGRQNYLVALLAVPLLARLDGAKPWRSTLAHAAMIVAGAAAVALPVFAVWRGLVPPQTTRVVGVSVWNGIMSFGYEGIVAALLAPAIFKSLFLRPRLLVIAAIVIALAAAATGHTLLPMRSLLNLTLGESVSSYTSHVLLVVLVLFAVGFGAAFVMHVFESWEWPMVRYCGAACMLGLLSNIGVSHLFSSRYVFVFFPFLVVALAPRVHLSWHLPPRLVAGAGLSLASLAMYFIH